MLLADLVQKALPKLYQHLMDLDIAFNTLSMRWFLCIYISVLPSETTMRVWDLFLREGKVCITHLKPETWPYSHPRLEPPPCNSGYGQVVLFQIAVAVLKLHSEALLAQDTFEDCVELLKELMFGTFDADLLIEASPGDIDSYHVVQ